MSVFNTLNYLLYNSCFYLHVQLPFYDTIYSYCVKQDESEENENFTEIEMQDM